MLLRQVIQQVHLAESHALATVMLLRAERFHGRPHGAPAIVTATVHALPPADRNLLVLSASR